jgi:predicted N-acetyltransferase YhbS
MELIRFGTMTDEYRAQLEGDELDPFDAAGQRLRFRAKERHVGLRAGDGRLVASAGYVRAEVSVASRSFAVVGIGGVIVVAEHRGRGLARRVMADVLEEAATLGPEFALLFCHESRSGLYDRLGFARIIAPVRVMQPDGLAAMPEVTMWRALRDGAAFPRGELTLLDLPF